jgi:two-component system, LuxR family, response regulator FixJ
MMAEKAHVFFIDDDPGVRNAVKRTLEAAGMTVTAFDSAEQCLLALQEQVCDVVVTDLRLGDMDGIAMLRQISSRFPGLPGIVVTAYGDTATVVRAMKAGALDFLDKPLDAPDLVAAVRRAAATRTRAALRLKEALSESEARVLRLILEGRTCKDIGRSLHRSIRTIESHRHHIMHKLGVNNIAQLIQRATELGFNSRSPGYPDEAVPTDETD